MAGLARARPRRRRTGSRTGTLNRRSLKHHQEQQAMPLPKMPTRMGDRIDKKEIGEIAIEALEPRDATAAEEKDSLSAAPNTAVKSAAKSPTARAAKTAASAPAEAKETPARAAANVAGKAAAKVAARSSARKSGASKATAPAKSVQAPAVEQSRDATPAAP